MDILIVGGTGILSTAVVQQAMNKGIKVTLINRGRRPQYIVKGVDLIKSDKSDYNTISKAIKGRNFDAIIDFLCYTKEEISESFLFYKDYTKQYVFISTCGVYNYTLGLLNNEEAPKVTSVWNYSVEKWGCEQHLRGLAVQSGINYTIIRPAVNYGDTRIPYGIVPEMGRHWTFISRILEGKPIITWNKGNNIGNVTHVDDFAVGVIGLLGNGKSYNETFNVCGDEMPSYKEMLNTIGEIVGKKVITIDIDTNFYEKELNYKGINKGLLLGGRALDNKNSNKKLLSVLPNFKQTICLKEGLIRTIESYKKNGYQDGIDWKWDADTDRIIKKWCRLNNISTKSYNLHFIDYVGSATYKDKVKYWMILNSDFIFIKILRKVLRR